VREQRKCEPTTGTASPNVIEAIAPAVYLPIPGSCINVFELFGIWPLYSC
jgi:hypothetical protein